MKVILYSLDNGSQHQLMQTEDDQNNLVKGNLKKNGCGTTPGNLVTIWEKGS